MRIICDLDGTLLDSKEQLFYAHQEACAECGWIIAPNYIDDYWAHRREGKTPYSHLAGLLQRSLTRKERQIYLKEYTRLVESPEALRRMDIFPETRSFLFQTEGVFLATFRADRESLKAELQRFNIDHFVTGIVACGGGRWRNRAKRKAKSIPKRWLDTDDEIWFIGDDYTDVEAAKILDVKSCAVCSGIRSRELLETFKPDRIIEHVGEFHQ